MCRDNTRRLEFILWPKMRGLCICLFCSCLLTIGLLWVLDQAGEGMDVVLADSEPIVFTDVTDFAGVNLSSPSPQWGGVWGDYDGDGYQDLYVGNHFNTPNLYHNNGDGTFTNMRGPAGIKSGPSDWHGAAWGDYNHDGNLDLYVVTGRAIVDGSDFYVNDGDGTFTERAVAARITNDDGRGRIPRWVDYDRDGDLDIFIANADQPTAPNVLYRNNNDGTFTDVAVRAGVAITTGALGVAWADYDNDGYTDFLLVRTNRKGLKLYRNRGNGTFVETTDSAGFGYDEPTAAAWGDYDNDGDLDLYLGVSYDDYDYQDKLVWNNKVITVIVRTPYGGGEEGLIFSTTVPNVTFDLWRSDRRLYAYEVDLGSANLHPRAVPFTLDSTTAYVGQPSYTPGEYGVFIWRDAITGSWNIRWSGDNQRMNGVMTAVGEFTEVTSVGLDRPWHPSRPNLLYRNEGDGTFERQEAAAGVADNSNTHDVEWIDFDNDGYLDLYVTNFGSTDMGDQPDRLYRNNGDGTFADVTAAAGLAVVHEGYDECSAWADYDRNGFLDLYLASSSYNGYLAGPHRLYQNSGNSNHWLQVRLVGTASNRLGFGAKIQVATGSLTQFREVGVNSSGACHGSMWAHFGLGSYTQTEAITVTWPSGRVQVLHSTPADQILTIVESDVLTITQSAPFGQVPAGSWLTFTIKVSSLNADGRPVTDVIVTDVLPAHSSLMEMGFVPPVTGTVYGPGLGSGGVVTWAVTSPILTGSAAEFMLAVQVHSPLTNSIVLTNTCGVTSALLSDALQCSPLTVTVASAPIISMSKQVYPDQVESGETVTYTIALTNSGNETAHNVLISDTLPPGFLPASMQWQQIITGADLAGVPGVVPLVFTATVPITGTEREYVNTAQAIVGEEVIVSNPAVLHIAPAPPEFYYIYLPVIVKVQSEPGFQFKPRNS